MPVLKRSFVEFKESQASSRDDEQSLGGEETETFEWDTTPEYRRDQDKDESEWEDSIFLSSLQDAESKGDTEGYLVGDTEVEASGFDCVDVSSESSESSLDSQSNDIQEDQDDSLEKESNYPSAIMAFLLQKLTQRLEDPDFSNIPYARLISNVGIKGIGEQIFRSLDETLKNVLESGSLGHKTIKLCRSSTIQSCPKPGVYIHVIFDPEDNNNMGIYVGQSEELRVRVQTHINVQKRAMKYKDNYEIIPKEIPEFYTAHMKFWTRKPHIQDFWVIFGTLDNKAGESHEDKKVYLNIMEHFAMLLFRSLPRKTLAELLPKGADHTPYAWRGLNSANPLKIKKHGFESGASKNWWSTSSQRQSALLNILVRDTDPNLGDLPEVDLMCPVCKDTRSYLTDMFPQYEISTGIYLLSKRRRCSICPTSNGLRTFVPVDISVTYKHFGALQTQYARIEAEASIPRSVTGTQLQDMKRAGLQAWLKDKEYTGVVVENAPKQKLISFAKSVNDYQKQRQDPDAERCLKEIWNEFQISSNLAEAPEEQLSVLSEKTSLETWIKITFPAGEEDLSFLEGLDLSQFPSCERCFVRRYKCSGHQPNKMCKRCLKDNRAECKSPSMGMLKAVPHKARSILDRHEGRKATDTRARKEALVIYINPSIFPKRTVCFARQKTCDGARPCGTCLHNTRCCYNVTEEILNKFSARARSMYERRSNGPVANTIKRRLKMKSVLSQVATAPIWATTSPPSSPKEVGGTNVEASTLESPSPDDTGSMEPS